MSVSIAAIDLFCGAGGLTRALRVAAMDDEAKLLCVPHSANLAMVTVFTLHNAWRDT